MSHAAPEGILAHIRQFFERNIEPDLEDLKADVAKVRELAPALAKIAATVTELAKADPGLAPVIVADVEEAAEIVAKVAAEFAASGM
jgi:hypothetical protein